ncbi:tRNA-guanine(15) transglycosylase-like protein [Hysterangium stoloniferum]|nr:tRNA-guanine(15) transglycosylase-like protein [Hysterangium stoloniferum]
MSSTTNTFNPIPSFTFHLRVSSLPKFSPRLGQAVITRPVHRTGDEAEKIEISTPGIICSTTRGVIEHLSRDHVKKTCSIKWVHVPFESFLQIDPPVPTRQDGSNPLHRFLGYSPSQHLLSLSLRDPADVRDMPANGNLFVAAQSSRGTRKVPPQAYRSYAAATMPDIVFSMPDVSFTPPPHSQKRINKSIERSTRWLASLLAPLNLVSSPVEPNSEHAATATNILPRFNVFLHMVGGIKEAARSAFASSLKEPLDVKESHVAQLETLDDGVSGYVFDLAPLRLALLAEQPRSLQSVLAAAASVYRPTDDSITHSFVSLVHASLQDLSAEKPRLVNTALSPHEMLVLIRDAGIDLFDTFWAQQAATWGFALDFRFPVRTENLLSHGDSPGQKQLGINIFDGRFATDFGRLAEHLMDRLEYSKHNSDLSEEDALGHATFCTCAACSPTWANDPLIHSSVDERTVPSEEEPAPPYTRAYIHHLLHTHEMSAHSLLAMHNITVMNAFMRGIRSILQYEPDRFSDEVARFQETYDGTLKALDDAKLCWAEVNLARGKGRIAREREASKSVEGLHKDSSSIDCEF